MAIAPARWTLSSCPSRLHDNLDRLIPIKSERERGATSKEVIMLLCETNRGIDSVVAPLSSLMCVRAQRLD